MLRTVPAWKVYWMTEIVLDRLDHALLDALIADSTRTNDALSALVGLSPSQCSRRRTRLEQAGIILGYGARVDPAALGYGLRAVTRVSLASHGEGSAAEFSAFVAASPEIEAAYSVSGDADYVLMIVTRDLAHFAEFVHRRLLPRRNVRQVRSDIVLLALKAGHEAARLPAAGLPS